MITFARSDMGRKLLGAEQAAKMAALGKDLKAKGEKYCFCPACQAGSKIYENKGVLYFLLDKYCIRYNSGNSMQYFLLRNIFKFKNF